ncbi:autotransporter outer membrane beta-barrel domain-containing protein [Centipeda periodontii]|nr:autotransporter outer membrane beta-barrel domain-containing protein [Centipeda periodontii]
MSRESQARRLALSVAVALSAGGGALFPVMPHASAADVTGNNVTVNSPSDPLLTAPGISGGEISSYTDAGNVTGNILTLDGVTYNLGGPVHGGVTIGTGNAQGNKLYLQNGADVLGSTLGGTAQSGGNATGNEIHITGATTNARGLYIAGGMTYGPSGDVETNKAVMSDGTAARLYGGLVAGANSTGNATGNIVELSGGTVNNNVAGGTIMGPSANSQGTGNVASNTVTITNGTVNGKTYGGTTQGTGSVTSNTVTVSGTSTILHDVLGGRSQTGDASTNILNFQGATADNLIGGRVAGTNAAGNAATNTVTVTSGTINNDVRGGEIVAPSATGNVSGNIVNINGGTIGGTVTAGHNMGTGKADGNEIHITNGSITGVVTGGHGTHAGEVSGNKVNVTNGTLSDNIIGGFAEDTGTASANKVTITGGTLGGNTIDGGFSVNGAASGNTATVGGISFAGVVTGGRGGAGADTNKVFLKNSAGITGNAYGGRVLSNGNVTGNELTIEASGATVSGVAVGGQNDVAAGDVTDNKAYMNAGSAARLIGGVVNGVSATGKASGNRAEVSGGSSAFIAGALISDTGATGEASDNHAVVSGANAPLGSIYGGITNGSGAAKDNTATISGSITANDVVGGQSVTGNAEGNKASFTQATVTNVRGARITGSGTGSAINNEATIAGGWVTGAAAGAEIQGAATGAVQDNTLTVTGGTVSGDSYGGVTSGTGDAVGNGVVVSGGSTSLNDVYGGSSAGGNAKKNYVTYSEATAVNLTGGRAQSGAGAVSDNKVEMTGGSVTNDVTGGLSYGSGTVEKNEVKISGGMVGGTILGGQNIGTGAASSNIVELTGGTINAAVYGGWANSGVADSNKVTVKKDVTGNIFGGNASGSASGNTVDLVGTVTVSGSVVGGQGSTANNNTVNLGAASVSSAVTGGSGSATGNNTVNMDGSTVGGVITVGSGGGTGNTLTVKGTNSAGNITGFQKVSFDLSTASTTNPMLNITNGWGTSFNWGALEVSNAEQPNRLVLMQNTAWISLGGYTGAKSVSNSDDTTEFNIDTENHTSSSQRIVSESYKYRLQDTPVTPSFDPSSVYGGISKVANSTRENDITVASGSHTNAYGGYTDVPLTGTGTTKSDRDNSYNNKITLSGGSVTNTIYGGYTWAPTGTTTNNTVNITGGAAANVVGAYSAGSATANKVNVTGGSVTNVTGSISTGGAASDNEITLGTGAVVTGYVMGGLGATATNNNKVTLEGNTTVTGILSGANMVGTGNTLTVKGNNTAGNITMFQKVKFDLDSASTPANAMLALTGGSTAIDWTALEAIGTATGARTLLSNTSGFGISGYTTDGTFVSETDEHEYFIDTDTHTATGATKINLDDYQFKNANVTTLADPNDTWAGRSKRGNTTQDNTLTITGGTGTNAYGGWTSTGSTTTPHADRFDSKNNTVNLNGGSITNVYGGYTTSAGGKATGNTVNVAGGTATNVVGGESIGDATKNTVNVRSGNVTNVTGGVSTGAASDNTINLGSVYIAGNVLGGQGTVTNDNKVNVEGTTVAGSITAGSTSGTGNKLTVKSANTAGSIAGFNKVIFDTDSATTNPMLTLNGGTSFLDWQTLEATGTSAGPITLMHNGAGLSFGGTYNGAHSRSDSDDTTEFNIDTVSHTASDNDVIAESYKYRGQTNPVVSPAFAPGNVYGGISKVGNATRENEITVSSGGYTDAFGGYTEVPSFGSGKARSSEKENSHDNKITIAGANVSGTVYGGYTTSTTGSATKNKVEVTSGTVNNIVGGYSAGGAASNNEITLKGGVTVGSVLGGQGATTTDNKVNLEGATVIGAVTGGSAGGTGHELTVRNTNAAGSLVGFGKLKFDVGTAATNPMLTLTGGASAFDWQTLEAIGTTAGPVTLMENSAGISFGGTYDGAHSGIDSADTTEFNIDTENRTASDNKVIAQSYQYRGQTNAVTSIGTDVYGGISRVANATRENNITVSSGSYTNAYGGYTDSVPPLPGSDAKANSAEKNNSHDNTITIAGANVSGTVYGGYTNAAAGTATKNTVNVTSGTVANVVGGSSAAGAASDNTINLGAVTVTGNVTGGEGTATNDNKVNVEGTTVNGVISGGSNATSGNTLTVKGTNSAGNITAFQHVNFDASTANAGTSMLTFTGGANALDWQTLDATGTSTTPITLMENGAGISFGGTYDGARSKINGDDTTEYNIDTENRTASDTKVIAQSYQYRGVTAPVTPSGSTDVYGGISKVGNATRENNITVSSGSYTNAYGGYTDVPLSGTDAKALSAEKNDSHDNSVTIDGATVGTVYGGYATSPTGKATKNTVNITSGTVANAVGGYSTGDAKENTVNVKSNVSGDVTGSVSTSGAASANVVSLDNITVGGNVTGGSGATTEDNFIHLNRTIVTGSITGGTAASGTGNTLVVHPGVSKAQSLAGIQNINFFLDQTHDKTAPILELTTTGTQNLQGVGIGVGVIDGAHPAFRVSEQFSLIKAPGGTIQTDPTIQNTSSAMQGVSLRYEFDVAQTATNEVSAVVKKAELIEQTKSFVETRVGATAFINQGVDFLVANNIKAAKDAASAGKADEATAPKGYQLWAGIGGSHMHSETGSYVDTNGLNVGVGWAREESLKNGNVVYGPFLSYGNASYDSYLNDNTHGSGKFRTYGLGLMVRVDRKDGMWYEGSLQGGRVKSDYDGSIYAGINSSYDVSNTYWAGHFAAGKDIQLKENAKITPYLRYFWSHQGDVTAHLNTGEDYDFSEVNSHRTRLGFRYTKQSNAGGEFYTGLALEYEFSGNAHASYQGYETPSPSLKGASGMLELGYRFMPADGNMRYDLRLMGWQGKRRGLSGDLGVKWMF